MNGLRKKREARRKATRKARAKREFARKYDGLNIWEVGAIYAVLGFAGSASILFWFYSILSMGVK